MKTLNLHVDYIKFKPLKKALNTVEPLSEFDKKEKLVKEALVVLTAVEKTDILNEILINKFIDSIKDIAKQVNTKRIVLYPYAHLSSNLSSPEIAMKILIASEKELSKQKFEVIRAPFGYYKEFELKVKGHPLSELSREIGIEEGREKEPKKKTQRETISEQIKREYYILTPEGKEYKLDLKDKKKINQILDEVGDEEFREYVLYTEIGGAAQKEPPSIKEMQRQELIGYSPEADAGHFKFYPKGNLIFELLKDWAYEVAVNRLGSLQIETPVIYDWHDKEIREQGGSFHERHYIVKATYDPEKEWVMRFAGDFGLFKIMKAANISYKTLPIRIYEFSKSFRYEQKGELSGLKRLRAFHMPDIHSFTKNLDEGWEEYMELYRQYDDLAKGTGIRYGIAFRVVKSFYEKNKKEILKMLKHSGKPAFIETLSEMKHYWAVKHELNGLDSVRGSTQLSTVQLDVKDAETYGITYVDRNNEKKGCTIVHSSVGSIERWIYCILEDALRNKIPQWPYWLSPTQIRVCPVSEKFNKKAIELANRLNKINIRTDVDDRDLTLPKKVSDSEKEWIPYVIVFGEKEDKTKKLPLRDRMNKKIEILPEEKIIEKLKKEQNSMPWKPLPVYMLMSKRPIFFG